MQVSRLESRNLGSPHDFKVVTTTTMISCFVDIYCHGMHWNNPFIHTQRNISPPQHSWEVDTIIPFERYMESNVQGYKSHKTRNTPGSAEISYLKIDQ